MPAVKDTMEAGAALKRIAKVVKVLKGLPRGAERRGLERCCKMYGEIAADLDAALPLIEKMPEHGKTLVQTIYLLRGIANMASKDVAAPGS